MTWQRTLSASFRREIEKRRSAEWPLVFLTVEHPSLNDPVRAVLDAADYSYNGGLYRKAFFDIEILTDSDKFPTARLTVQNVDRIMSAVVSDLILPPTVKIEIIPMSDFDLTVDPRTPISTATPEYTAENLFLIDIEVDAMMLSGRLVSWNYSQETWPGIRATQNRCPALFR